MRGRGGVRTDLRRKTKIGLLQPKDHVIRVDSGVTFDTEFEKGRNTCVGREWINDTGSLICLLTS